MFLSRFPTLDPGLCVTVYQLWVVQLVGLCNMPQYLGYIEREAMLLASNDHFNFKNDLASSLASRSRTN